MMDIFKMGTEKTILGSVAFPIYLTAQLDFFSHDVLICFVFGKLHTPAQWILKEEF